jgi:hypothetical protein
MLRAAPGEVPGPRSVLVPDSQSVLLYAFRYREREVDPPRFDLRRLLNGESLLDGTGVVIWQASSSTLRSDRFSQNHWFFR